MPEENATQVIELPVAAPVPNGNRIKIRVLAAIAVLAQMGVIAGAAAAWFVPPQNEGIVMTALAIQQSIVASIVGFLTGASQPDRMPEGH